MPAAVTSTAAPEGAMLGWDADGAVARLGVAGASGAPRTEVRFVAGSGRVAVVLALLRGRRAVDVSIQPGVVAALVREPDAPAVAERLADFAGGHDAWSPPDPVAAGLLAVVAGAAFPLLGAASAAGAAPLAEVPRWAAPVVAAPTARAGAERAFGARATRPVVAAFAASLVGVAAPQDAGAPGATGAPGAPGAPIREPDLAPLALGLMAPALEPDRLARVLRAGEGAGQQHPRAAWPDVEVVAIGRRVTPAWGEHRTERVLLDAAASEDGLAVLTEALRLHDLAGHRAPARLPNRLVPLRDELRTLLPADPNPEGLVAPRRRPARVRSRALGPPPPARPVVLAPPPPPPAPTADERRGAAYRAPASRGAAPADHVALSHPPAVLVLAGREVLGPSGPLRLVVPRSGAELGAWGTRLGNCVGGFAAAVAEGRSIVLGVEAGDRLAYCLEIRPDGGVRQFLAARNRPVPRGDAAEVLRVLVEAGVVRTSAPGNDVWFDDPPATPVVG